MSGGGTVKKPTYGDRACTICGVRFVAASSTQGRCSPECAREHKRRWSSQYYTENREAFTERSRAWAAANPDRMRERSRRYERENRAKRNARPRDPLKRAAQYRQWYVANREYVLDQARKRADPELKAFYQRRRRARALSAGVYEVTQRDLNRCLARLGHRCAYCREPLVALHWDHVVPLSRGGTHSIGNLLPSCPPCNQQKSNRTLTEWRRLREHLEVAS